MTNGVYPSVTQELIYKLMADGLSRDKAEKEAFELCDSFVDQQSRERILGLPSLRHEKMVADKKSMEF